MLKKEKCTDKEWQHCRVEKMGCKGCHYDQKEMTIKEAREILDDDKLDLSNEINLAIKVILRYLDYYEDKKEKYKFMLENDVIGKGKIKKKIRELEEELKYKTTEREAKIQIKLLKELLEVKDNG